MGSREMIEDLERDRLSLMEGLGKIKPDEDLGTEGLAEKIRQFECLLLSTKALKVSYYADQFHLPEEEPDRTKAKELLEEVISLTEKIEEPLAILLDRARGLQN